MLLQILYDPNECRAVQDQEATKEDCKKFVRTRQAKETQAKNQEDWRKEGNSET